MLITKSSNILYLLTRIMNPDTDKSIVLFDGVCNLCNGAVQFILQRDRKEQFLFASLQSDAAKEIMLHFDRDISELSTIYLVKDKKLYDKSTAALLIANQLNGFWPVLTVFLIIPKFIRDPIYTFIAKNRYKWFGKKEQCMVPDKGWKKRFL